MRTRLMLAALLPVSALALPVQPAMAQVDASQTHSALSPDAPADAVSPAAVHLSLDEAVAGVLEANPGLAALRQRAEAAGHSAKAASRTRWGQLDAVGWYSYLDDDRLVRPISKQLFEQGGFAGLPFDRNQLHYGLTYQIPLYLGGELSSGIDIAELEAEKTAAQLEGTTWQLRFNATSLYTGAQTLDAVDAALGELVLALETNLGNLDLMVDLGKRPEIDRLKVVEQLEEARAQRESVRADRVKVGATLLALLGRDPSERFEVDPLPETLPSLAEPTGDLRAALADTSPIRQAHLAAEQGEEGVDKAFSGFLPKIVASGSYFKDDAPSLDEAFDTWQVTIGVRVPLLHGTSRFERFAAAKELAAAAERAAEQTRLQRAADLEEALARLRAREAELEAARARVRAGDEAARIETIRYDTGAGSIEDLLRAESRRSSAKASLAKAMGEIVTTAEQINSLVEKEAVR